VLVGTAAAFGVYQTRAARRAFENRLLYDNQKRIADALQTAFLNTNLPSAPSLGLHATYIPAVREAQVGGDWYDAFELPDKRILFSIGDVAGHGLDAAIVMSRARQAIIAAALHENDPGKVLGRANDAILLQDARMVTAICGYIDPTTFEVTYATAGHPPPILARAGSPAAFLPHAGIPLGILASESYPTFVATAADGAVMVLYTDGVIEHKRDIVVGETRLLEAVSRAVHDEDPALTIQRLIFAGEPPTDDVAILTVTFRTPPGAPAVASIGALQLNRLTVPGLDAAAAATGALTAEYIPRSPDDLDARLLSPLARR
jgi:serine phosphatase RsbU (regulator of sigma subunit)